MIRSPFNVKWGSILNRHADLPRRRFSAEQKVAMVREAMQPNRSIAEVGRLYGVNQNQLSRWIFEYRDGAAWSNQIFVPVELVEAGVSTSAWFDADARERMLWPQQLQPLPQ